MKAWEIASNLYQNAKPIVLSKEEQTWEVNNDVSKFYDDNLMLDWTSHVPGSGAPEKIMVAAVQALENRGYLVSERGYELLHKGIKAQAKGDIISLHKISSQLRYELNHAEKDESSEYWKYHYYTSFEEYLEQVTFPDAVSVDIYSEKFRDQLEASWLSQMIGGAMGTMVEGYTAKNLQEAFGDIYDYLREPNTFNDDITFELAFLEVFKEKGYSITSKDIALSWVGLIPCGWSAEELALRNIKAGLFPPESGRYHNPFNEWIGAQMKAGICGMVAPGNPKLAAELAWKDGEIAHANNGILGEVFNAVMTSLAFGCSDIKEILKTAAKAIPKDSEYYSVIMFAFDCCQKYSNWRDALHDCEEKYKEYNWIHAYPNLCCEIIALWYGESDYTKTLHIITMCGVDVDCNAGMIMPILGIIKGTGIIPPKFMHEAFLTLETYMRGHQKIALKDLVDDTLYSIQNANKKEEEMK